MALRVAQDLRAAGDEVFLLIHDALRPIFQAAGFSFDYVVDHLDGLVRLMLDTCMRRLKPTTVIYFDYFNTANYLHYRGISDTSFLLEYDSAVMSLDTWDYQSTGHRIDLYGGTEGSLIYGDIAQRLEEFERIDHRLIPVPMAPGDQRPGKFACLPTLTVPSTASNWRSRLCIPDRDRLVLFCTAPWQQHADGPADRKRLADVLPALIGEYFRQLGPDVHLVHVGPEPYPLVSSLGENYHWLAPLGHTAFNELLRCTDLFLSANISATTITRAFHLRVPVLVLENSRPLNTIDDAHAVFGGRLTPRAESLLKDALPIYAFSLWPLGYHEFLHPLLENNPYCEALDRVELLDEAVVLARCRLLLDDADARQAMADRQEGYLKQVAALPSAADVVHGFLA